MLFRSVLVTDDLLGLNPINLRFLKKYSNLRNVINTAVSNFKKEVKKINFLQKNILIKLKVLSESFIY